MIPVFQTRYATETFGNCYEACIASILELPLTAIPDRSAFVDLDAWANLVQTTRQAKGESAVGDLDLPEAYERGEAVLGDWLRARGIGTLDLAVGDGRLEIRESEWMVAAGHALSRLFWIAHTRQSRSASAHATVWRGNALEHNPSRGWLPETPLGPIHAATLLIAGDPPRIARRLDPLPDVEGLLEAAVAG